MNYRSRPQGLALIALAATHLSNLNAGTGAAKPFASLDAGDAYQPQPHGAKKQGQGQRPTAKKQIVIGDQPKGGREAQFGGGIFKPVTTSLSIMPAYHEGRAVAKKDHAAAKVPHLHATNKTGGLGAKNHHYDKVGVMDLMAAAAKPYGPMATVLRS